MLFSRPDRIKLAAQKSAVIDKPLEIYKAGEPLAREPSPSHTPSLELMFPSCLLFVIQWDTTATPSL